MKYLKRILQRKFLPNPAPPQVLAPPMTCRCHGFGPVTLTRQGIFARIRESRGLGESLRLVERDDEARRALWRCPACGEAWQGGRVGWYGGQHFFRVPPIEAGEWRREAFIDPAEMVDFAIFLRDFLLDNRDADSDRACAEPGCSERAWKLAVFCARHHIAMLQRAGQLASPPSGRLFESYGWARDTMKYLERAPQRKHLPNPQPPS